MSKMNQWLCGILFLLSFHGPVKAGGNFDVIALIFRISSYLDPASNHQLHRMNRGSSEAMGILERMQAYYGSDNRGITANTWFCYQAHPQSSESNIFTDRDPIANAAADYIFSPTAAENELQVQDYHRRFELMLQSVPYVRIADPHCYPTWARNIFVYIQTALLSIAFNFNYSTQTERENLDQLLVDLREDFLTPRFPNYYIRSDWCALLQVNDNSPPFVQILNKRLLEVKRLCERYLPPLISRS